MENMPTEILLQIFSHLCKDVSYNHITDVLSCELTCKNWNSVITYALWKKLCQRLLISHSVKFSHGSSELKPTFVQHEFESKHTYKTFYLQLLNLYKKWDLIQNYPSTSFVSPQVTTIDTTSLEWKRNIDDNCFSKIELKVAEHWRKKHNYRGIYDMVYVKEKSLLVASVDDKIQVWNVSGDSKESDYNCQNVINAFVLDSEKEDSSTNMVSCCFYVTETGRSLVCGTQNSKLKLFDLCTPGGRLVETYWVNGLTDKQALTRGLRRKDRLYVSDVRIRRNVLIALDWYGNIHEWKVISNENTTDVSNKTESLRHVRSFLPSFGPLREEWDDGMKSWWHFMQSTYSRRFSERLLDFCDEVIVVSKDKLMCILPKDQQMARETAVWIETNNSILCCKSIRIPVEKVKEGGQGGKNRIDILCGQQQGFLLKYTFNEKQFVVPGAGGFTYMKPPNPNIIPGSGIPLMSVRRSILHSDIQIKKNLGGLKSLYVFQTFYKSSVTAITVTMLPYLNGQTDLKSNYLTIVGDRDGELYCLYGTTLKTKFHIGFKHSNFADYDEMLDDSPNLIKKTGCQQGTTYDIRGRLPENQEQDCTIWSIQADSSRIFSGDSNGVLVVHDFWKNNLTTNAGQESSDKDSFGVLGDDVTVPSNIPDYSLSTISKRQKFN